MAAVFSSLTPGDFEKISIAFGLEKILQTAAVAAGSVNTIYRLQCERGVFYLRLDEVKDPLEVARELSFTAYLAARGFPTPAPLSRVGKECAENERFLLPWNNKVISVFAEVKGAPLDPKDFQEQHLHEIGAMLAHLHQLSEGYAEPLKDRFGLAQVEGFFQTARQKVSDDLQDYIVAIDQEILFQKNLHEKRSLLPQGVVHGDAFADNLFFVSGHLQALIDFDAAASRELLYDLTTAMNALCWKEDDFCWLRVSALLKGYEAKRKLAAKEREQIVENWRLSSLRFTVTRIKDFHLRAAGKSGLIHRDFRDFYRRLTSQQNLTAETFWKKIQTHKEIL